jgi:hypothetical protein
MMRRAGAACAAALVRADRRRACEPATGVVRAWCAARGKHTAVTEAGRPPALVLTRSAGRSLADVRARSVFVVNVRAHLTRPRLA